ncbi:MAG: mycothione reductase [Bowdeniella nasicola]|nr:mycothione reductase [Bowdeniella nasicola]
MNVDLAIVGSGSGNAIPPSLRDHKIALIDDGIFGGTCLNVGCIPTKMHVYPADVIASARTAGRLGVDFTSPKVNYGDIQRRIFANRIDQISAAGLRYRREECDNIEVLTDRAFFTGPHTLTVGEHQVHAKQIMLVAGARPAIPEVIAQSEIAYQTSDTIMRLAQLPEHLIILGSGYIACEFAHIFSAFGSKVTVIGRSQVLLKHQDHTIATRFTDVASQQWDVRLGQPVVAARQAKGEITLTFADGSRVSGDELLVATGRIPNSDRLEVSRAGIATHPDGRVQVDCHGRTNVPGVWACGDISSPYQLKHVANHEADVVFHNLTNPTQLRSFRHQAIPAAVFTWPQIASVGLTEEQAKDAQRDYVTVSFDFGAVAYGWAMEDEIGICKLLADPNTGQLLGAHILGEQAALLLQGLTQAMALGTDIRTMAREQYWIHPALSEVVENALLALEAKLH